MTENKPLVSIVMLNFNGVKYLQQTLPAVLALRYSNIEVVVVDNGSTDGSVNYLRSLTGVTLIENDLNLGYSKGKNIGVTYARGEYVLLIDNDILIESQGILEKLLELYSNVKNVGLIQVPLLDVGEEKTKHYGLYYSWYGVNSHQKRVPINAILNYKSDYIPIGAPTGGCMFFNREIWSRVGGFDEIQTFNIDDIDIGPRFAIWGYKSLLYTRVYFIHLGIANVMTPGVYASRYATIFSGHARSMLKNYSIPHLLIRFPLFYCFQMLKTLQKTITKLNLNILLAFVKSHFFFMKSLPSTLILRRNIQSSRHSDDFYLRCKIPTFKTHEEHNN